MQGHDHTKLPKPLTLQYLPTARVAQPRSWCMRLHSGRFLVPRWGLAAPRSPWVNTIAKPARPNQRWSAGTSRNWVV